MKKGFFKRLISGMMIALTLAALFCVVLLGGIKGLGALFVVRGDREAFQPTVNNSLIQIGADKTKPMPDVAIQAVFVTDEEGRLCRCFYTLMDCQTERLEFYMVPLDTRLQLSIALYQELVTKNATLAQVNTLEGLYRCFTTAEAAACTVKALDEAIGVQSDYYTVMPQSSCERILKTDAHTYAYDDFLQDNLQEQVIASGSMKAYLSDLWEQCESSASIGSRLYYLESYEGLTNLSVSCRMIAGERHNNGYGLKGNGLR